MEPRILGRSGIAVDGMGLGCWAIGGPFWDRGGYMGYGTVDSAEAKRALQCALELGIRFFDVAGVYGCGQAETLLGEAIKAYPDVIIAAKFGYIFSQDPPAVIGKDISQKGIQTALEQSLKHLQREYIDIYQLHLFDLPLEQALEVSAILDGFQQQGLIRAYSWCNEQATTIEQFARASHASVIPILLNVLEGNKDLLTLCETLELGMIIRRPLGMGLLTGKIQVGHVFDSQDMRIRFKWNLEHGKQAQQLEQLQSIQELLTQGGRTLAQGALAWLWAINPNIVPIPGFKTVKQVEENVAAMQFGALPAVTLLEIEQILKGANAK